MSRFRTSLLLLGLLVLPALSLLGVAQEPKGKKYALLVGVNDYANGNLAALKYAENDVEALEKLLRDKDRGGFAEVRVLSGGRGKKDRKDAPTAANVRKELKSLFEGKSRHDVVLVAFAGHGVQLTVKDPDGEGPDKTLPCFCPSDAQLNDTNYKTGKSPTLLNLDSVVADLGKCGAGAKLLLVDACRDEVVARNLDVGAVSVPKNVMALFSCDSGQKAFESEKLGKGHGVFFYFVLEALRGKAKNDRGEITWAALSSHVTDHVPVWVEKHVGKGARQTPHEIKNVSARVVLALAGAAATRRTVANAVGMELVEIPAGEFDMGAPADEKGGKAKERPRHAVRITKGFFLGATEVTQSQYREVMGKNPSDFAAGGDQAERVKGMKTDDHPVENVSHADAVAFCTKLSARAEEKKAKRTYRLPSEAEWEYACRAGTNTAFHTGDKLTAEQAIFAEERTAPVKTHKPNAWGLYGMHGNVREWVADWYGGDYYDKSPKDEPKGPATGTFKVVRGGAWPDSAVECRSAAREETKPLHSNPYTGFRVVMEQP